MNCPPAASASRQRVEDIVLHSARPGRRATAHLPEVWKGQEFSYSPVARPNVGPDHLSPV